jgi:methyl-accepting chemotaxis protein
LYVGVEEKPFNTIQKSFRNRVMLLVLFFIALGAIIVYFSTGFIIKPIEKVSHRLKDIAEGEGDLTKSLEVTSNDEIGELAKWFNVFVAKLHSIIHKVSNSTNQLASAAEQLSASSAQISSGAEKQTSQTEHIATSMEEMSATIIDIAKNANEAAEAAKGADEKANKGGEIVKNTVEGMNRIAEAVKESAHTMQALKSSSEQIGEIIGVIDDIADQTNLLALNAAIEAARAGEQGRGFAVVADEVRKLAERTTKATKEIAEMIKSIQSDTSGAVSSMEAGSKEVEKGVALANEAGEALKQIVEEVLKVTDMVQQIATSTEEQSAATEEVSSNIESVSTVAKETSSGMEQSTNAIQELSQLATGLKNIVGQFKLKVEEEVNVKEE